MNTSNFAKYKGLNGVSIAIKSPANFNGPSYPKLFPKWSFLSKYKKDGDQVAYTKAYHKEVLSHLDPNEVYNDLKGMTLLCWERSGFCHRRLVAIWLKDSINIDVPEIS
jgi:hypothetical protein